VNSPLQGTAADLIKLTMVNVDRLLREEKYEAEMLLQVHDELAFEAPPEETQEAGRDGEVRNGESLPRGRQQGRKLKSVCRFSIS
jgi:hypothetical protein